MNGSEFVIVIPVFNALDYLQSLLGMIDHHYPERRLVLVDDCSDEPTRAFLREYGKNENTTFIQRNRRGWFTRSVNTGLKHVLSLNGNCPKWVICMNSDCTLGEGGFEELFMVWRMLEEGEGRRVGIVGADGPKPHCPRYITVSEPDYVTMHCVLFKTSILIEQNLLFPWKDGQVRGFNNEQLVHINSDRALSYEMNRRGLTTGISYHSEIGHHGGRSWGHQMHTIPMAVQVGEE